MQWVDENGKLIGMDTPKVVIDNAVCPTATLVHVRHPFGFWPARSACLS
jgi:hypothetical protein